MKTHALLALKSRFSMLTDVDLAKPEVKKRAEVVEKDCAANTPLLQRLLVHRSYMLSLMAVMYTIQLAFNIWVVKEEFDTYNSIKRCPTLPEASFLTEPLKDNTYYTGWWEKCGASEDGKQYRVSGKDATRSTGSYCFYSLGVGESYTMTPLTTIAKTDVSNVQQYTAKGLDLINATTVNDYGVYIKTDPSESLTSWYSNHTARAAEKVFSVWAAAVAADPTFTPKCTNAKIDLSSPDEDDFGYFTENGEEYEIQCFIDEEDPDNTHNKWYYWTKGQDYDEDLFDYDSIFLYTKIWESADSPGFTAANECGALPDLVRSCCTSKEVLHSGKNSPDLIRVRKGISLVNVIMNGASAFFALYGALNWKNLRVSQKCVLYAWLTPFVVACVLGTLPLATMAKINADKIYDDTLIKTVDDAAFDSLVSYFNILMPAEAENLVETLQYFYDETQYSGRLVADIGAQIEFRIKAMVGTMLPLAITALTLPVSIEKAAVSAKEMFPSAVWIGWITRIMPMFYMPWAAAMFCALCQIFSGPYITVAFMSLLMAKIVSFAHNPGAHTKPYTTYEQYRAARKPTKRTSIVLMALFVSAVGFFIAALFTDKYAKLIGIVALIGEIDASMFKSLTARLIITIVVSSLAKSANAIVMFNDIFTNMVAAVAGVPERKEDTQNTLALKKMLSGNDTAPDAESDI